MIRRIVDFVIILLFVWVFMFAGLWVIATIIVPLELPGIANRGLTNIMQVVISTLLVLIWLQIWRWLASNIFWRAINASSNTQNTSENNGGKRKA
jgi:hypothetical protein